MRIGAPDPALTPVSGMVAASELPERLDVIGRFVYGYSFIVTNLDVSTGRGSRAG